MTIDSFISEAKNEIGNLFHAGWMGTVVTVIVITAITAIAAHLVTVFLRRILKSKSGPLPAVSIFINIGRVFVWAMGISIILSTCFNVDVKAAITALGVGGIAISLGFQDTLSNLIGGLQIIMTGLIEPGDRVKVGNYEGIVHDVSWRHTTIITVRGEEIVVPNSVINTEALVKLTPERDIRVDIMITEKDQPLDQLVEDMEKEIDTAVKKIAVLETPSNIDVLGKNQYGYRALVSIAVSSGADRGAVIDTMMKAISKSATKAKVHKKKAETPLEVVKQKLIDDESDHVYVPDTSSNTKAKTNE